MYVCMYVCLYICMFLYMYVYLYVGIDKYSQLNNVVFASFASFFILSF